MKKLAAELDGKELLFQVKIGAKERMHGSITAANIATQLQEVTGQTVDKRKIELEEPLKTLGSYDVAIKLLKGIEPRIKVNIVKKEEESAPTEAVVAAPAPEAEPAQSAEAKTE